MTGHGRNPRPATLTIRQAGPPLGRPLAFIGSPIEFRRLTLPAIVQALDALFTKTDPELMLRVPLKTSLAPLSMLWTLRLSVASGKTVVVASPNPPPSQS